MIVINARFLTQPISGVQRFAIEICKELQKSGLPIIFVAPKNIIHHDLAKQLNVKSIGGLRGHLWEQITLQLYVLKNKALLLSLCNTAPLFVKHQIITIHDLCFIMYPEWFSKSFSMAYNFLIPRIVKRSQHILTVSQTSKEEIANELSIPKEKISVIYNAVTAIFKEGNDIKGLDNYLLKRKYILTVSSHHPRKNFKRLIEAFNLLEDKDVYLYIIGNVNKHFVNNELGYENNNRIQLLKDIPDNELVMFYKNAELFVYPSLYEGFGIPIIEALSQHTQVCVSNIPVFREVCGPNAIYFDPKSILSIKNGIIKCLRQVKNSRNTFDVSVNLALKYSWKSGADKIIEVIKRKH